MENTSTKIFTSLLFSITKFIRFVNRSGRRQLCLSIPLIFALIGNNPLISKAQSAFPTLQRFAKPSPEPAAPGDSFTPTMSGAASGSAPQAAEWTRTAGPDESIVLTGVDFSSHTGTDQGKDSRFMIYGRNGIQREGRIQRLESDKAIITLPKDLPSWSMYLIWPGNEAGYGNPIAINKTDAWWVGPDKATRGQTVSVFGRNLTQNNDTLRSYVYIKPVGSAGQWAAVTQVNPYKVDFTVPTSLANGEYEIWTHNGHGGQYGWSGPQKLTVYNGPQWTTTTFNVKNYGATGNGSTDDTEAIRKAMLAAKSSVGSTVYFPAGVYMLSSNLQAYSNIRMKGDGQSLSVIKCASTYSTSAMALVFGTVQNFAISDMGFEGNNNFRGSHDKPIFLRGSSDIWITNVRFSFANFNIMDLHNCRYVFLNKTEHIGITSFLGDGSQLFFDRNSFKLTNDTDMAMHSWSGTGISMTRSTCSDLDNSDPNNGAGWGKGRVFTGNGTWGSNRNTYLGNNITTDLTPRPYATDQNSGEQFLWEGNLGSWAGYPSSSTSTTTTVPGYSSTAQNKKYAVIVKGRGIGQSRRVVVNNSGIITLDEPWNVIPDASSYIVIGNFVDRIAVYNNYLDGKPRAVTSIEHIAAAGIEPYGGIFNFIAANNTLHELRQGVANWSTQHTTGLDPNYFSMYTNNKMVNCRWGIYNQLILSRPEGTAILGTTYRNNNIQGATMAGINTSVSTSGQNSLDSDIYEYNSVSNVPVGLSSGNNGIANQLFYKNNFNSIGGTGIAITNKMALRENSYQGVSTLYKGSLSGTTVEAPLHVIDLAGIAGGSVVNTDFTIKNSSITRMNWVASSSAPWLTFSATSGSIPDERCVSLVILTANPTGLPAGSHTATITVTVADQIKKYTVVLKLSEPQNDVTITAPTANKVFSAAEPIVIAANATDSGSGITKVEFFNGSTKLGEDLTSPYNYTWNNAPAGTYTLTAKGTNGAGLVISSAPVSISVTSNAAPTVSITSPAPDATFAAPASITINANAADTDGSITKVEFFSGATKLGEDLTSPYSFNWYNVALGSYTITARATDNSGTITTSAPVTVHGLTNSAPVVLVTSPGNNATYKTPTNVYITANAELTNGFISKVEFFNGATKLGEKIAAPYDMYWMNTPAGTYAITAKATGNNGVVTTSAPVSVTVVSSTTTINAAPTVSISSPTATSSFTAPASITINANASDVDGNISKVEFFYGTTKVGEDLSSPYSFTWDKVAAGSYSLTARATDNVGTSTTSAPVAIKVATANTTSNIVPTVSVTSPSATSVFTAPAIVSINANAADADGTIAKVEFFNGTTKLGEDTAAPYAFTWSSVAAGNYTLTARAIDNIGATTTSAAVSIVVNAPVVAAVPPSVAITSPIIGTTFTAPAIVSITANAADTDGTIAKVEFFNGSTKLGEDLASPYAFTWSSVASGTYTLTAKATDNAGLVTTSAPVGIVVNAPVVANVPPTVAITAPTNGEIFTAPADLTITANAADTDGTIAKVEFFNGTTKLGEDTAAPYAFTWSSVAAGTYTLTAKATDNAGLVTTSAAVSITSKVLAAPTVVITSPATSDNFLAIANINITATAADADGTVIKVEFYNGSTKIGEDLSSPYSFAWNNISAGNYTLTAKAFDNTSLSTVSAPVNITVTAPVPPTVVLTSPTTSATFTAPASLTLSANAADTDGSIAKVEFYQGSTKIGEDVSSPYSYTWNNVAAGTYNLTAKAYDYTGLSAISEVVTVYVNTLALTPPTVAITSPTGIESYKAPASITITSNVTDTDGTISKVEYYQGTTLLGTSTTSPYSFTWNNVAAGTYSITAKATDNDGLATTSTSVQVTVEVPAIIVCDLSLSSTYSLAQGNGGNYLVDLIVSGGTAPFIYNWSNGAKTEDLNRVKAGTYTVVVTDANGCSATTAVIIESITYKAYPNPASTYTTIEFTTEKTETYSLEIYDTSGFQVKALQKGTARANELVKVTWQTAGTPIGIYYAKLITKSKVETIKIVVD